MVKVSRGREGEQKKRGGKKERFENKKESEKNIREEETLPVIIKTKCFKELEGLCP